jgi:hypothetical protein
MSRPIFSDGGQVPRPLRETRSAIKITRPRAGLFFAWLQMPPGQSAMSELSDDERQSAAVLRRDRARGALTSTCSTAATLKNGQSIPGARGLW